MTNPLKGETPLKLDDEREFVLVLDFEALIEAEAAYGKPLDALMADAAAGFVGASRALLYGALRARHPKVSLRAAGEMLQADTEKVTEALAAAADIAFPAAAEGAEGKKGANPPGKTSGGSGAKQG